MWGVKASHSLIGPGFANNSLDATVCPIMTRASVTGILLLQTLLTLRSFGHLFGK